MKSEPFQLKEYFKTMNLVEARMMCSLRLKTTGHIKTHFMSDKKYASELWVCGGKCQKIDSIFHLATQCEQYEHLRKGKDILSNDKDLVLFFAQVLKSRDEAQKA